MRLAIAFLLALYGGPAPLSPFDVAPALGTDPVASDPDDPAIWVHPSDPSKSLVLGTNKTPAPSGALAVFGLDGKVRQVVDGIDRPNNVDVEYSVRLGGKQVDIAVLTERLKGRLRVFAIDGSNAKIADISHAGGIPVFEGEEGERRAPMGIALYRRGDGVVFAIVGRKTGPAEGYLWQYRLEDGGGGKVKGVKVREFGRFSGGAGEIEAIAVDDELGYVYYADEGDGIHKWHADPDHPRAAAELAHFGRDGFRFDREGIAIYRLGRKTGYIVCTDQIEAKSEYRVFRREGTARDPHDHSELVAVIRGESDSTDGLDASSSVLSARFPKGILVAMNSAGRNFLLYDWRAIAKASGGRLRSR